jgi:ubiquitin carboxyl-terminal hydrolase 3
MIHHELFYLFDAVWCGSHGATNKWAPHSLFATVVDEIPHFGGNQQQDAHEFLKFLLDRLDAEYQAAYETMRVAESPPSNSSASSSPRKGKKGKSTTKKKELLLSLPDATSATLPFEGRAMSRVCCGRCSRSTETEQPFLDISVDIPERTMYLSKSGNSLYQCRPLSLDDCLRSFTHIEKLGWSEKYQ